MAQSYSFLFDWQGSLSQADMFCAEVVAEVSACLAPRSAAAPVELPVGRWVGVPVGTPVSVPAGSTVWMAESPPLQEAAESAGVTGVEAHVSPAAAAAGLVMSEGGEGAESLGAPMCKGWDSLAAQLCAQELEQVSYDFFWDGCLWGRCCLCPKHQWLDLQHVNSEDHLRRLTERGAAAARTARGLASSPKRSVPDDNIKVYHPSTYTGGPVDGAILTDSIYYFKNSKKGRPQPYMEELLDWLLVKTGKVFMAVCSGGAGIAHLNMNNGDNRVENLKCVGEAEARKLLMEFEDAVPCLNAQ